MPAITRSPKRATYNWRFCWSHVRRPFYEIAAGGDAPIAIEGIKRIANSALSRPRFAAGRQTSAAMFVRIEMALVEALKTWMELKLAAALRYALSRWVGLTRFLDDRHIEIDSNVVERAIRPLALNRKNALFAGSDGGGEYWAIHASLIETCKLDGIDPQPYLADIFARLVEGHPINRLDELLPWNWAAAHQARRAA